MLSLFSGAGMFDSGFRDEGFCVVSAGDVLFGQDVRDFHPPAGVFDGVIGGDPCQSHSALANLVRAKGLKPSFPDMTPEFKRVVEEGQAAWFLRENVPQAPDLKPDGYDVRSFLLDNSTLDSGDGWGHEQMRRRRFWFGTRDVPCPELRAFIEFALFVLPDAEPATSCDGRFGHRVNDGTGDTGDTVEGEFRSRQVAADGDHGTPMQGCQRKAKRQSVAADSRAVPVRHGGSGKVKVTADGAPGKDYSPPRRSLEDMLDLQGYPRDFFGKHSPFTMQAKRKLVGNAVSRPMSRAIARAVVKALESELT